MFCGKGNNYFLPSLQDIARLLQQKELQEEKKRKKHYPESQEHKVYEDSYYSENGGKILLVRWIKTMVL